MDPIAVGSNKRLLVLILGSAWLAAVSAGVFLMNSYANQAGSVGRSPSDWPEDCAIPRDHHRKTLLMFLHPRCPCSRASLRELAGILARTGDRLDVHVVVYHPTGKPPDWSRKDLWNTASDMPGVRVLSDVGGATAAQFGAKTSGHALLYETDGRLLFSGGITAGRGHEGGNPGSTSVVAIVRGEGRASDSCPVFGCPIIDSK